MPKTHEEMIKEFFDKGGKVEILPTNIQEKPRLIGSLTKKVPKLMTLSEGEEMFGEVPERQKNKKIDVSNVDMNALPEHIKRLILSKLDNDTTKENQ
jgi:hypothetical protein